MIGMHSKRPLLQKSVGRMSSIVVWIKFKMAFEIFIGSHFITFIRRSTFLMPRFLKILSLSLSLSLLIPFENHTRALLSLNFYNYIKLESW